MLCYIKEVNGIKYQRLKFWGDNKFQQVLSAQIQTVDCKSVCHVSIITCDWPPGAGVGGHTHPRPRVSPLRGHEARVTQHRGLGVPRAVAKTRSGSARRRSLQESGNLVLKDDKVTITRGLQ